VGLAPRKGPVGDAAQDALSGAGDVKVSLNAHGYHSPWNRASA
jgi:hypothetical protein